MNDLFRLANRYSRLIREARSENGFPGDDDEDFVMFFQNMLDAVSDEEKKLVIKNKIQFAEIFRKMYDGIQSDFPNIRKKLAVMERLMSEWRTNPYLGNKVLQAMDELKKEFESSNHRNFREYIS